MRPWWISAALAVTLDEVREAERLGQPAREAALCQELVAEQAPESPAARTCEGRLKALDRLRDPDGSLDTYAALEAARRGQALDRELAWEGLQPDLRVEVVLWLAAQSPHQAVTLLEPQMADLDSLTPLRQTRLRRALVRALSAEGRLEEARAWTPDAPQTARSREADVVAALERRRGWLAGASWVSLGLFALIGGPLAVKGWAPRPRPWPVGALALLGLGGLGALIAGLWDAHAGRGALAMVPALVAVHLVAAGALRQAERGRWALRLLSGLASAGAGFLVLRGFDLLDWVRL